MKEKSPASLTLNKVLSPVATSSTLSRLIMSHESIIPPWEPLTTKSNPRLEQADMDVYIHQPVKFNLNQWELLNAERERLQRAEIPSRLY